MLKRTDTILSSFENYRGAHCFITLVTTTYLDGKHPVQGTIVAS
ncbi:hypothetical protein ASZ90_015123 [hydrocarbon metagenome]|uniref:Peptidylprolyl isomerase n=1 Tax=hydrocarbon metagenome TaxID=938273 RepID=A0A0W8F2Z1_9ZZZZ